MRRGYAIKRGDNLADPSLWEGIFPDIDNRLNSLEVKDAAYVAAASDVIALGLERVNGQLTPLVAMALAKIASVANLFEAASASSATIAASGEATFVVSEADRAIWPLPSFVSASVSTDAETNTWPAESYRSTGKPARSSSTSSITPDQARIRRGSCASQAFPASRAIRETREIRAILAI
jgi:hypothetical protein